MGNWISPATTSAPAPAAVDEEKAADPVFGKPVCDVADWHNCHSLMQDANTSYYLSIGCPAADATSDDVASLSRLYPALEKNTLRYRLRLFARAAGDDATQFECRTGMSSI